MVALIVSVVILAAMAYGIVWYAGRRPADQPTTWGEAMVGAVYVFMMMFMVFGIVPNQFIQWATNDLGWKVNKFVFTEGQFFHIGGFPVPPFRMTQQAVRDILVMGIYVAGGVGIPKLAKVWRTRGERAQTATPLSDFGRPLIREV